MRLAAVTATTPARATAAGIIAITATTGITENRQLLSLNTVSDYLTA